MDGLIPFLFLALICLIAFIYRVINRSTFQGSWKKIKSPLIVFDFDGTICPSYPIFIDQMNLLAEECGMKKIRKEEEEEFRNLTPAEILKRFGVSLIKLPFLLRKVRRNVQKDLLALSPVPGIVELLQALKNRSCSLGILTSNSPENVQLYLRKYKLDAFDFVYTANNVFNKEKYLKTILKKGHLDPEKHLAIYIGDEIRDIDAAKKGHFKSLAVTWGYNSLSLLQTSQPDFIAEDPSQIFSFIFSPSSKCEKV